MTNALYHVTLTEYAFDDLDAIAGYIAYYGSVEDAVRLLDKIDERIVQLERFPMRGSVPKELQDVGRNDYRQSVIGSYRIFYRVDGNEVTVNLIADGRRDMQELLRLRLLAA